MFKNVSLHNLFLLIAVPIGMLFTFIIPPFQVPDESAHYFRSLHITSGNLFVDTKPMTGGRLPVQLVNMSRDLESLVKLDTAKHISLNDLSQYAHERVDYSNKESTFFDNTAVYSPLVYVPQSTGLWVAQVLQMPALYTVYVARLFNLFAAVLLVYVAIKNAKYFKQIFFVLGAMPMTLFLFGSMSADALTIAICIFAISYFVNKIFDIDNEISKKDLRNFSIINILLVLVKLPYAGLTLLSLLVLYLKKDSWKNLIKQSLVVILPAFLLAVGWYLYSKNLYNAEHSIPTSILDFIKAQIYTFTLNGNYYLESFVGRFGWLETTVPFFLVILPYAIVILIATLSGKTPNPKPQAPKLLLGLIATFLATFFLVNYAVYTFWFPVVQKYENLFQGRYYIPFFAILCIIVAASGIFQLKISISASLQKVLASIFYAGVYAVVFFFIVSRYWA